ncbi:MAG: OFA family MFS transporter [Myxococcaceae bacterium]|nr:OFA family MFS transporter [Myxococcaceae bacterium]
MPGFFSKEALVARPGTSRWWVAPAALAIHLSIGQAYAFSVFNLPLQNAGGWKLSELGWVFTCAIASLGLSAALFGQWLERVGPRVSGLTAAACFSSGLFIAALGASLKLLPLLIVGYGLIGGIGLGLGYITPVSTLIKWFPDRRGMATGIAIMGFGGGAIIAAPLSRLLMKHLSLPATFAALGVIYLVLMTAGALGFRTPPPGFAPKGTPPAPAEPQGFTPAEAVRTRPFWLLWVVLCVNVTAGIGVLGQASAMIQEVFKGAVDPDGAATFVSALSASNMVGRFVWASLSDRLGRKVTYGIFFSLGPVLYFAVPLCGAAGSTAAFVACFCVILTMYGGGFATIPAYLSDLFGTRFVSAIHGRLLTAWSVAGVLGPVIVNYVREYQIASGVPKADAYDVTMRLMAGLLVVGFIANVMVRKPSRDFSRPDGMMPA